MQRYLQEAVGLMQGNTRGGRPILSPHASPEQMYHYLATIHWVETSGRLHATSWTGVQGSMQVTQATFNSVYNQHRDMLVAAGVPQDRTDPRASAIVGALYYNQRHIDLGGNAVAAAVAYNSGPEAGRHYDRGNITAIRAEGRDYAVKFERDLPRVMAVLGGLNGIPPWVSHAGRLIPPRGEFLALPQPMRLLMR
jgi:hypothetical protein